ncbi:hypothetical protein RDV84_05055 [Lysobacter yananisis]|uniref:CobW C-terminal domain-containing protein n=1 Tax=Lysobacter yananisis TaxID=1003114 RepID=A0ABY9PG74_9GAMM|nr:hypothetical protein [Lysobacter yananisis]WMT05929.1 hypothetical protein RDV84_05055 [Lysobacter yananisis]
MRTRAALSRDRSPDRTHGGPRGRRHSRRVAGFGDRLGTGRWATKIGPFDPARLPRVGDPIQVWFLREAPGDEDRIVVGFGSEEDAGIEERLARR